FTHNPVFPFLSNWFGYRYWNAEDLRQQLVQMHAAGAGHGLKELLLLPWNLIFADDRFVYEAEPSAFFLLALPLTVWGAVRDRRIRSLLLLTAAFVPLWFARAQFPRYLLPVAPILALASAAAVVRLGHWLEKPKATAFACACLLTPTLCWLGPRLVYPIPHD